LSLFLVRGFYRLSTRPRKSGQATLRADLAKRSAAAKAEIEMGDINPLANSAAGDSSS